MKTTTLIVLFLCVAFSSCHVVVEQLRGFTSAFFKEVEGPTFVIADDCLNHFVDVEVDEIVQELETADLKKAWNTFVTVLKNQLQECPTANAEKLLTDVVDVVKTGKIHENLVHYFGDLISLVRQTGVYPLVSGGDFGVFFGKITNMLVYDRTTPPETVTQKRNLRQHFISLKALSPVDFLKGVVFGASDVDEASNQCVPRTEALWNNVTLDVTKLLQDLQNLDFSSVLANVKNMVKDVTTSGDEDVCHFVSLYFKLQNPLVLLKAVEFIAQNFDQVKSLAQAAVDAVKAGDAKTAGLNVGKILRLALEYHTQ